MLYVYPPSFLGRSHWQLGSLSHTINADATGYIPLPSFPTEVPDPTVRDVEEDSFWAKRPDSASKKKKDFYSGSEEGSDSDESGSDFYSSISGSELSGTEDSDEDSSEGGGCGQYTTHTIYSLSVDIVCSICLLSFV